MRRGRRELSALLPVVAWLGVIAVWSTSTGSRDCIYDWVIGTLSRWFPGLQYDPAACAQIGSVLGDMRKPAHLFEYAVLALLTYRALALLTSESRRFMIVATLAFSGLVGALDEYHQSFDPTRTGLPTDAFVDVLGAGIGLAVGALVGRWRRKRRR